MSEDNQNQGISHNSLSGTFQNRVLFYFLLIFAIALVILKMPMSLAYYETVRIVLTFAPLLIILVMTTIGFISARRNPEYQSIIRKFYLLFTFKFLLAIFAFYLLYAPTLFFNPVLALLKYLASILTLEGFFYLLSYILISAIALTIIFIAFRAYQQSKGTYDGSLKVLTKKSLYGLFALSFFALIVSASAYPQAYRPMTNALGDILYTMSAGNIQAFKGDDVNNYKKIKSIGEFASSLSTSLAETSQNLTESNEEYKTGLSIATNDLKETITKTTQDLKDKLEDDISESFSASGGTISGDITIKDTTYLEDIIPRDDSSYDLGSNTKSFSVAYITRVTGLSEPSNDSDAATKLYVDTAVAGAGSAWTYNANNLKLTVAELDTIQDIGIGDTPTFAGMTISGNIIPSASIAYNLGVAGSWFNAGYITDLSVVDLTVWGDITSRDIIPSTDSTYDLGSSSNYFDNAYIDNLYLDGRLVVNEAGADRDTRIEGDTDENLLFVDASRDNVGIGGQAGGGTKLSVFGTAGSGKSGVDITVGSTAGQNATAVGGYTMSAGGDYAAGKRMVGLNFGVFNYAQTITGSLDTVGINVFGYGSWGNAAINNVYSIFVENSRYLTGTVSANNWYGIYVSDIDSGMTVTNNVGMYLQKSANGINNYQMVLAGNDTGSGLWLNGMDNNYARIYSPGDSQLNIGTDNGGSFTNIMFFNNNNVGIGDATPDTKLKVVGAICAKADGTDCAGSTAGTIYATAFVGDGSGLTSVPDYVFEDDYKLMTIDELETYVNNEKHLPNVPNRDEIMENGLNFGNFAMNLLEKTEENVLYTIQNNKAIQDNSLTIEGIDLKTNEDLNSAEAIISLKNKLATQTEDLKKLDTNLQAQIDTIEAKLLISKEVIVSEQTKANTAAIDYIKALLGLTMDKNGETRASTAGLDILGKITTQSLEAGKLVIRVGTGGDATIGSAKITSIQKDEDSDGIDDETGSDGLSVTVETTAVNEGSKIFTTINSKISENVSLMITEINDAESFTVEIVEPIADDVKFNWWIVEKE